MYCPAGLWCRHKSLLFHVFDMCVCVWSQPADCRALIEKLKACTDEQLLLELQNIKTWNIGKVNAGPQSLYEQYLCTPFVYLHASLFLLVRALPLGRSLGPFRRNPLWCRPDGGEHVLDAGLWPTRQRPAQSLAAGGAQLHGSANRVQLFPAPLQLHRGTWRLYASHMNAIWPEYYQLTFMCLLVLFTALDHASSIVWHAGGAVCAEPLVCVQQALQLHHQVRLRQEEPFTCTPATPGWGRPITCSVCSCFAQVLVYWFIVLVYYLSFM